MSRLPTVDDVARPAAAGYGASLDGLLLRLAATPETRLEIAATPNEVDRVNTADSPEEVQSIFPAYSIDDVTGGEGLFFAHHFDRTNTTARDSRRFWRSRGIDIRPVKSGEADGFRLLRDVADSTVDDDTSAGQDPRMVEHDGTLYIAAASGDVNRVTSPLGAISESLEDIDGGGETAIVGLARLGGRIYAAVVDNKVWRRDLGASTWTQLANSPGATIHNMWSAKGRILVAKGTYSGSDLTLVELIEIDLTDVTTGTTLLSIPNGVDITDVIDAGASILVAATNGTIYALAPDASSVLTPVGETRLPQNRYATCLAQAYGTVVMGLAEDTTAGGRFGSIYVGNLTVETDGSYALRNMQLYKELDTSDGSVDRAPRVARVFGDSVYLGVRGDGETILWRYDFATGALSEDLVVPVEGDPVGLEIIDGRKAIMVAGQALYIETATYVASGYLISSAADFFTAVPKAWMQSKTSVLNVGSGATVSIRMSTDLDDLLDPASVGWDNIGSIYDQSQSGELLNVIDQEGQYGAVKITLTPSASLTVSPIMQASNLYASPQAETVAVRLPVNVSDRVERRNRRPLTVPGMGSTLLSELIAMRGKPVLCNVYRPSMAIRGVVRDVESSSPGVGRRSSGSLIAFVTVVGTLTGGTSSSATESALGVSTLGLRTMGA